MNATIEGAREALNHSLGTLEDGELRRLLEQERESKLAMVAALDESRAREEAMRAALNEAQSIVKRLDDRLAQACVANDALVSLLRKQTKHGSERRERPVESAEEACQNQIAWWPA